MNRIRRAFVAVAVAAACGDAAMAASATMAAGVLIDVADNAVSNGIPIVLGPINVSKYSEISMLTYAAGVTSVGTLTSLFPVFTATATAPTLSVAGFDSNGPAGETTQCRTTALGTWACFNNGLGTDIPPSPTANVLRVAGPYVYFIVQVPTTISLKLWAKP